MKDKFKNFFSKKNVKIQNLRNKLKDTQLLARRYLEIVNKLKNNKQISADDFNYIASNSGILQLKVMKLKPQLGVIHYKRPFNFGEIPNYEVINNFPILLSNRGLIDEAISLIPAIDGALSTYNNMVDEIIKDDKKLKLILNKDKKGKLTWKILKEDRKSIYNVFLIPTYIISFSLLFYPKTVIPGLILNFLSVFLIILLSFLSKSD